MTNRAHILSRHVVIPAVPPDRTEAEKQLREELGRHLMLYAWPGIVRLPDGELIVGASEHVQHVDPYGRDVLVRSTDSGETWTAPEVFWDSVTDDRDIALNRLSDGTLVATWFSSLAWAERRRKIMRPEWEPLREQLWPETLRTMARGWLRRSTDGGKTWEDEVYPTLVGQHAGPTPLANGDLIYCGPYKRQDGTEMVATRSSDGGRSWQIVGRIPSPRVHDPHTDRHFSTFNENHAVELPSGRILVALRGAYGKTNVYLTHSDDGGGTWSEPEDLGVFGYPPYLLRMSDGRLLCIYSVRGEQRSIQMIVSEDNGESWDTEHPQVLYTCDLEGSVEMGYPSAVELSPGELYCIFYCIPTEHVPDYNSLDPADWGVLAVRFRLEP